MPSKDTIKQRQAMLRALGYKVPNDGSWGPWQLSLWDKLKLRDSEDAEILSKPSESSATSLINFNALPGESPRDQMQRIFQESLQASDASRVQEMKKSLQKRRDSEERAKLQATFKHVVGGLSKLFNTAVSLPFMAVDAVEDNVHKVTNTSRPVNKSGEPVHTSQLLGGPFMGIFNTANLIMEHNNVDEDYQNLTNTAMILGTGAAGRNSHASKPKLISKVTKEEIPENHKIQLGKKNSLSRILSDKPTYVVYNGPKYSISDVVDSSGNVDWGAFNKISEEITKYTGGYPLNKRLENPTWHPTDWNTMLHTLEAVLRAKLAGYSPLEIASVLGHDLGKSSFGEGHGPAGASLFSQIFTDATPEQVRAIYEHMDSNPSTYMGQRVKGADIKEANGYRIPKSTISAEEKAGIPRGERNNVVSAREYPAGTALRYVKEGAIAQQTESSRYPSLQTLEKAQENEFTADDPYLTNRLLNNRNAYNNAADDYFNLFGDAFPDAFLLYLEENKDYPINEAFLNTKTGTAPIKTLSGTANKNVSDLPSLYVRMYRKKLSDLGYDPSTLTNDQILRIISLQYDLLSSSMTGKTKGQVFWHGSPEFREIFDFSHTGENTGNMGAMGPGNYFSSGASNYGGRNYYDNAMTGSIEPFLINDIKETPVGGAQAIERGDIPQYYTPGTKFLNNADPSYEAYVKDLVSKTPVESNRLWIDPAIMEHPGVSPELSTIGFEPMEFMLRRNTGIKSLFPDPKTFTTNSDGRVVVNRNWDDSRVSYKLGGKF